MVEKFLQKKGIIMLIFKSKKKYKGGEVIVSILCQYRKKKSLNLNSNHMPLWMSIDSLQSSGKDIDPMHKSIEITIFNSFI